MLHLLSCLGRRLRRRAQQQPSHAVTRHATCSRRLSGQLRAAAEVSLIRLEALLREANAQQEVQGHALRKDALPESGAADVLSAHCSCAP